MDGDGTEELEFVAPHCFIVNQIEMSRGKRHKKSTTTLDEISNRTISCLKQIYTAVMKVRVTLAAYICTK